MTVIVYRDGVLAADTGEWCGDVLTSTKAEKLHRTPAGEALACAGVVHDIRRFRLWADEGFVEASAPKMTDDFGAIVVKPDGIWRYDRKLYGNRISGDWAVEGCNHEFLMGALAAGASARRAVELAIKHTSNAGGEVRSMKARPDHD